jgi:hypothetical protein
MIFTIAGGANWKQWDTAGIRQQSCSRQFAASNSGCQEPRIGFRTQQACGAGAATASSSGAVRATKNITSSALAVSRCMILFREDPTHTRPTKG